MKSILFGMLLLAVNMGAAVAQDQEPTEADVQAMIRQFEDSLDKRQGDVALPGGVATLHVPDAYYYLSPADAEKVLVQVWGNPPGAGSEGLGMLFPADTSAFDENSWAATIDYEEDGYVSDSDAATIDYDDLLVQMQDETRQASDERVNQGYEPIKLVGWAARPYYDNDSHKLHWAKELQFGENEDHTLNYNIRVLGRKGVLVINFIAGMEQKTLINSKLGEVLAIAEFDGGSRYEDFNPDIDKVAAYGIGALVAGKLAAKAGLLGVALLFLKKFGIFLVAGLAALGRKLFGKKEKTEAP